MIRQVEDKNGVWGTTVLIALFFAFICCFAQSADKPVQRDYGFEPVSALHVNATAINDVQQVVIQKSLLSFSEGTRFNLLNQTARISAFDRLTYQKITFVQKVYFSIKSITGHWFFNQFHFPDDDFPPVLS
jgi:hypothetical protein